MLSSGVRVSHIHRMPKHVSLHIEKDVIIRRTLSKKISWTNNLITVGVYTSY